MLFYTLGLQCYSNNGQKTKMMIHFCGKKKQKQNSVTIMISGDGKGTISSVKLKLKGESFE